MIPKLLTILLSCFIFVDSKSVLDFIEERNRVLATEDSSYLGSDLTLNDDEVIANDLLMGHKVNELETSFINDDFPSSINFFQSRPKIEASNVYQFIHGLPKGAALHLHEFAITSIDWVVSNITYRDNLYSCYKNSTSILIFGWFASQPDPGVKDCDLWVEAKTLRAMFGSERVDSYFKSHLSIVVDNPEVAYPNVNTVWAAFAKRFGTLMSLLNYKNLVFDYFYQGMQEFYDDGVQYMEVRTVLAPICSTQDEECNPLSIVDSAKVFKEAADQFALDHPDNWCGLKMIYGPSRRVEPDTVTNYFDRAAELVQELPDFILGFDMVGQEDLGRPLIEFLDEILAGIEKYPDLKVFFHAGETDWQGSPTDLNIIDALLLNTTRIGHGYAIAKHPEAQRIAREKNIPIEVNPISNQVLGLVKDLRNHPVAPLIQQGFPIVISADDPGLWDAKGLSYDYYSAFMAMAGKTMNLKLLKKLVQNSLEYSTLQGEELEKCSVIVGTSWDGYMKTFRSDQIKLDLVDNF